MTMPMREPTEAELADMSVSELERYAAGFTEPEPIEPAAPRRLDASISVRFSADELDGLRQQAEATGMKVTAFIRALVLQHAGTDVVDLAAAREGLAALTRDLRELQRHLA